MITYTIHKQSGREDVTVTVKLFPAIAGLIAPNMTFPQHIAQYNITILAVETGA